MFYSMVENSSFIKAVLCFPLSLTLSRLESVFVFFVCVYLLFAFTVIVSGERNKTDCLAEAA